MSITKEELEREKQLLINKKNKSQKWAMILYLQAQVDCLVSLIKKCD